MDCFFLCGRRILQRILLAEKWLLTPERATFIRRCAALLSVIPASRVTVGTQILGLGLEAGQQQNAAEDCFLQREDISFPLSLTLPFSDQGI